MEMICPRHVEEPLKLSLRPPNLMPTLSSGATSGDLVDMVKISV